MTGILNLLMGTVRSAVVTDPYFEYTTLLLPGSGTNGAQNNSFVDSSANAFPITRNPLTGPNAPTQGTFSPFSQTGWGNYFDGTTDYLSTPSNSSLALGSGDFTLEGWIYSPVRTRTVPYILWNNVAFGANFVALQFDVDVAGLRNKFRFFVYNYNTSTELLLSSSTFSLNTWNHVAISRNGNAFKMFVNGVLESSNTFSGAVDGGSSQSVRLGSGPTASSDEYTGYISNFRIVKGQALYTGAFTPATSALTASTVGSTGAGVPTQTITGTVSLLTCQSNRFIDNGNGNSGSGFTITVNGSPSVVAFSPFNPTASWSAATNGGSGYFDGNGDSLSGSFSLITSTQNTFSFEGWLYPLSASAIIIGDIQPTGTSAVLYITISASRNLEFSWYDGATKTATSTATLSLNQWNFFAVVVNAGAISIYVNSTTPGQTGTTTLTNRAASTTFGLGAYFNSGYLNGYVGSLRVSTSARTISAIPTEPYTSDANTKLLLNFTNAGVYDATSKNDLETVGDVQISTTQSKWGGSSMYFDGNGDQLFAPSSVYYVLGTGDFTVELWAYSLDTGSSLRGIVDFRTAASGTNGILLRENSGGFLVATGSTTSLSTTTGRTANAWQHIALVRSSGTLSLYVGGSLQTSTAYSTNLTDNALRISGFVDTSASPYAYYGYMQDLRISKYARYTTNFTPPTAAFPTL